MRMVCFSEPLTKPTGGVLGQEPHWLLDEEDTLVVVRTCLVLLGWTDEGTVVLRNGGEDEVAPLDTTS